MKEVLDLISTLFYEYIFQYPGAFIRWIFVYKKRTFKEVLKADMILNATIGSILVIALLIIFLIIIYLIAPESIWKVFQYLF